MKPLFSSAAQSSLCAPSFRSGAVAAQRTREQAAELALQDAEKAKQEQFARERQAAVQQALAAQEEIWQQRVREAQTAEQSVVREACTSFARERAAFFQHAEAELADFALRLAGRVLEQVVALDPLALQAVVAAALRQLGSDDRVLLHVPASDVDAWRRDAAPMQELQIEGDGSLQRGACRLETSSGLASLDVDEHLQRLRELVMSGRERDAAPSFRQDIEPHARLQPNLLEGRAC